MTNTIALAPVCDAARFRALMGRFATGVAILTFRHAGAIAGTTINGFMSVSLDPQLVLTSVRTGGKFNLSVAQGDLYGISFLSGDQQALSGHFAGKPADNVADPFVMIGEIPVIRDALAQMVVRVRDVHDAGDHKLYVSELVDLAEGAETMTSSKTPLIFYLGQYFVLD